ncbi:MAG: Bug family tripartite tricarboxylate transporter substrate binding protein [Hyphomicrobiaceae bacterium]
MLRRTLAGGMLSAAAGLGAAGRPNRAAAQEWPARPVRMIVTFSAGGSTDVAARLYAEKLGEAFRQQFVIENKAGASGMIGLEAAARAEPDGYTFGVSTSATFSALPAIRKLPIDISRDLAPVGRLTSLGLVFAVKPSLPVSTWAEFVEYAKARPGQLNFGSAGVGVLAHFVGEYAARLGGFQMTHIPYKGGADAQADFLGGRLDVCLEGTLLPYLRQGKGGKMLAYVEERRSPDFPDVPTMREIFPSWNMYTWFGVAAPAATPPPIIARLNQALAQAATSSDLVEKLRNQSQRASVNTPAQMREQIQRESELYARLAKELNIRAD